MTIGANVTLRDYQENQLNFLKFKTNKDTSNPDLFNKNIYLESPTGSGKSIVILQYIKDYFSDPRNRGRNIFISTGFNELVYQFFYQAKAFGIDNTEILIGRENAYCPIRPESLKSSKAPNYVFDNNLPAGMKCNKTLCKDCVRKREGTCGYYNIVNKINTSGANTNLLVITNHSSLFFRNDLFSKNNFVGGFLDECQSLGDFYDSYMSIEIPGYAIKKIYNYASKYCVDRHSIELSMLNYGIRNGKVSKKNLLNVMDLIVAAPDGTKRVKEEFPLENENIEIMPSTTKSDYDNYIHPQYENGRFIGIKVDQFYKRMKMPVSVCITSATVDKYTKSILDIKDNEGYIERDCNIIDYKKSHINLYTGFNEVNIKDFISKQTEPHGLILSTRLDLVEWIISKKNICGYEIITSRDDFIEGKKQILVGSKKLFQGIDIGGVNFVLLNKIPFQRYDNSYKKRMDYYTYNAINGYNFYTIPYATNQLIQMMGRLWRNPGDKGNIGIFDKNAVLKHPEIFNPAIKCREGIKVHGLDK